MKQLIFLISFFIFLIQMTGCIKKNEVELYAKCDTNNMSYAKDIRPIIQTNCYRCHDVNNAPLFSNGNLLDDYNNLKAHIRSGLINNIEYAPNFLPMPKGAPKLSDCDIAKIKAWVHQDTLNN
jgi:mono/diheme cytochrome c family protein